MRRLIFQFYLEGLQQRLQFYEERYKVLGSRSLAGLRGRHLVCGDPAFYGIADPPELLQVWDYYGSTDDSV